MSEDEGVCECVRVCSRFKAHQGNRTGEASPVITQYEGSEKGEKQQRVQNARARLKLASTRRLVSHRRIAN